MKLNVTSILKHYLVIVGVNMSEKNISDLRKLTTLTNWLCLSSIKYDSKKDIFVTHMRWGPLKLVILSVVMIIVFITRNVFWLVSTTKSIFPMKGEVFIRVYMEYLLLLFIVIYYKKYEFLTADVFKKIREFPRNLENFKFTNIPKEVMLLYSLFIDNLLRLWMLFYVYIYKFSMFEDIPGFWIVILIAKSYICFIKTVTELRFILLYLIIVKYFDRLNRNLLKMYEFSFKKIIKKHHELHEISRSVNKSFYVVILFLVGSYTLDIMEITFHIYYYLQTHQSINKFAIVNTVIHSIKLTVIIKLSDMYSKKISEMKSVVCSLVSIIKMKQIKKELNAFALQMLHENSQITAGGCFPIDFSLFFKIGSACSSFIIIMVQFYYYEQQFARNNP